MLVSGVCTQLVVSNIKTTNNPVIREAFCFTSVLNHSSLVGTVSKIPKMSDP